MNERRRIAASASALLCIATLACGTLENDEPEDRRIWGETTLVEDLRIGRSEGPSEYLFGGIVGIVQHPDGTIFIADRQVLTIRRYDAAGNYLHDIGREGQGPGEFQVLQSIQLLPDGNLVAWDPRGRRVTVFTPEGDWVSDFIADSGLHTSWPTLWTDFDGNIYVLGMDLESDPEGRRAPLFLKYSPDGELIDRIIGPPEEADSGSMVLSSREGFLRNFTTSTETTLARSGHLVAGHNGDYSFEIRDGEQVLVAVEHDWQPVRLQAEERAQWTARQDELVQRFQERPPSGFANVQMPEFAPVPATKPAYMDLWSGQDGTIWVRRYAEARERTDLPPRTDGRPPFNWWQRPTFDVFDLEATFLGIVELDNDTRVRWFHSDYIWTVRGDENDEDVAVRYRVEKSRDGS